MARSLFKPWWAFWWGAGATRVEMYDTKDEAILAHVPRGHEHGTHYVLHVAARPHESNLGQVFTRDEFVVVTDDMRLEALERKAEAETEAELKKKKVKEIL